MKKIILSILIIFIFVSCFEDNSTDGKQKRATEKAMQEAHAQVGMPAIHNFQERKLVKMLLEIRDKENIITYAYIVAKMTGKLVYLGKCIGYGIPYSAQFSNPEKLVSEYSVKSQKIPQPEPNGIFVPDGLSATWLMLIDKKTGKARPVYIEPSIIVSPFPLH
jgi:hypothetical protein